MSFSGMNEAPAYVTGPLRSFHKSSYERFLLYEFVEPMCNCRRKKFVALTNLCETEKQKTQYKGFRVNLLTKHAICHNKKTN